jgi:hypothetical protein
MRYPITLLSFFLIVLLSVGCGNSKKARKEATASVPGDFRVLMERMPCFGTCPAYNVQIDPDGKLTYTGVRHTERQGVWERQLSKDELNFLWQEVRRTGFFDLKEVYDDPNLADAPSIYVTVTASGKTHKVQDRLGAPQALKQLEAYLDTLTTQPGFVFVKAYSEE